LKFEIPIELAYPMDILVTGTGEAELQEYHLSLSSLPPVLLEIVLPPAYPLRAAPEIISFHVSGSWIPRSGRLLEKLQGMWQPGEVILYAWVEGIQCANFLDSMSIMRDGVLRCVMKRDGVIAGDDIYQNSTCRTAIVTPFLDCIRERIPDIEVQFSIAFL
jgi:RWD domain